MNPFTIYDKLPYLNKPQVIRDNGKPLWVIYEPALWPVGSDTTQLPDKTIVDGVINEMLKYNWRGPVVLDIEMWPVHTDTSYRDKLLTIMQWFKEGHSDWKIGNYAIAPARSHTEALLDVNSTSYKAWQAKNDAAKLIADASDILCPSLYVLYADKQRTLNYLVQNLAEAQRYSPLKPIYPFLWPKYHTGAQFVPLRQIDANFWYAILETVWRQADGCILWDLNDYRLETFSPTHPLVVGTTRFLNDFLQIPPVVINTTTTLPATRQGTIRIDHG
jgi:hypothetical protein